MPYIIGVLVLVAAAGFAAGFFLAPVPLIVLAVIGVFYTVVLYSGMSKGPPGTSGGIGLGLFSLLGPFFLFFLAIGVVIGYGCCGSLADINWPSLGQSLSEFFLRQ